MSDLPALPPIPSRRRRTVTEKLQIVQESLAQSVSIAAVSLAHRMNANQLHRLR